MCWDKLLTAAALLAGAGGCPVGWKSSLALSVLLQDFPSDFRHV